MSDAGELSLVVCGAGFKFGVGAGDGVHTVIERGLFTWVRRKSVSQLGKNVSELGKTDSEVRQNVSERFLEEGGGPTESY